MQPLTQKNSIAVASASNLGEIYATSMEAGELTMLADEPLESGGKALGPNPVEYLCMALASCKVITLRMYAGRKNWQVDRIDVKVELVKEEDTLVSNTFFCELTLSGNLTPDQRKRMLEISKKCPIDRMLGKASSVVTILI